MGAARMIRTEQRCSLACVTERHTWCVCTQGWFWRSVTGWTGCRACDTAYSSASQTVHSHLRAHVIFQPPRFPRGVGVSDRAWVMSGWGVVRRRWI